MVRNTAISADGEPHAGFAHGERPNIAFAGLTAAGKTTHARLLADALGYEYVSATKILLEIVGLAADQRKVWFNNLDHIQSLRAGDQIDNELERQLLGIAASSDGLVLDTWAMPWICDAPMIRVWLESDRLSRTWKCFVSQGSEPSLDLVECSQLIDNKDTGTREIFLRRHNFDLFASHDIFDIVLDNTWLIDEPNRLSADAGIEQFAPVMLASVRSLLDRDPEMLKCEMSGWSAQQRRCLRRVVERQGKAA